MPKLFNTQLTIPLLPNMVLNTKVTATIEVIFGMKYKIRKVFLNLFKAELSMTATNNAMISCGTVPIKAIIIVLLKEIQNVGSLVTN
ncbi:hypothetical protein D3C80_1269000 [compost metagenome]